MAAETRLAARGLAKSYGPIHALIDAAIDLVPGEVHAIVGENGAGKSTLAKILAGAVAPDAGDVLLDGRKIMLRGRRDAIAHGIGFLPQALSLVGALTLVENKALGEDRMHVDAVRLRRDLDAAIARTGLAVALDVPVGRLSVAERQLGELLLAVAQGVRILLLDEPTSMLGPGEVERLVRCLRELARNGVAVGLVTHRIAEVLENSDCLTVMRGGRVVHHGATEGLTADELARLIVGERDRIVALRAHKPGDRQRLVATDLAVEENGVASLDGVTLAVREGEVLGIAGVASASQRILADVLTGLRRPDRGRVTLDEVEITGDAALACRLGIAHVADERAFNLAMDRSIAVNASLLRLGEAAFHRFGLRRPGAEAGHAGQVCHGFEVRPAHPGLPVFGLSGGNQQKLILGRELERNPPAIVAHSPTQGLDLSATAAIHNRLLAAADAGAAVVVISADLDEIMGIADRLVVLSGGRIADEIDLRASRPDSARLGAAMTKGRTSERFTQALS
jgi:ABC-type uncharacterized transport system ATPase subunit